MLDTECEERLCIMSSPVKKQKASAPVFSDLTSDTLREHYKSFHATSQPYPHVVLDPLCDVDTMRKVHKEVKENMTATFKETDLFKVFQTADLGNISPSDDLAKNMPELMKLRDYIYSDQFRAFIQDITGSKPLIDKVDCSANAYVHGGHLMCHDDVIDTRCVSYIIYLTDPDAEWKPEFGGGLELFPLEPSSVKKNGDLIQGLPANTPTNILLPKFNTMALFKVQPGRSYHAVQEVYTDEHPRLSISGWYHAASAPEGVDMASRQQIKALKDSSYEYKPAVSTKEFNPEEPLDEHDLKILRQYINPEYLTPASLEQLGKHFLDDASVQLCDFLRADVAAALLGSAQSCDASDNVGNGAPPSGYNVGANDGWEMVGPPHKRRYLRYSKNNNTSSPAGAIGKIMQELKQSLFQSPAFFRFLAKISLCEISAYRNEVRRFRPGLDYTIAHRGDCTEDTCLDVTLCFVDTSSDEKKEQWENGDMGGFECFVAPEDDENTPASAAVYIMQEEEEGNGLLSISPGSNVLNIVLRQNEMHFVKYVSAVAPSSRWDIAAEYVLAESLSDDEDDDDEEDEDDEDLGEEDGDEEEDDDDDN